MKTRTIINAQIEIIDDISEEDFKEYSSNQNKNTYKPQMAETLRKDLNADKLIVKSYRIEKEI